MKCMDCGEPIERGMAELSDGDVIVHADCDLDAIVAAREAWIESEVDRRIEERG